MNKRLGKNEWISAGLRALLNGGHEAVRIERLAEALCVTKGSFYWHFRDRNALLNTLLDEWKARATQDIIDRVEASGGDASQRMRALFSVVIKSDGRLDQAIRNWSASDTNVKAAMDEVDRKRLAYLGGLFLDLGFSDAEATARARMVYQSFIGQFMMEDTRTQDERLAECVELIFPMLVLKYS